MKTLADLKRRITKDLAFTCENYTRPQASGNRVVTGVQTNGFWFVTVPPIPGSGASWLEYPKRRYLIFDGDRVTFLWSDTGKPAFTYDFGGG